MQPDRPELCRFWLASLTSALETSTLSEATSALQPLVVFLWRYTWATVPEPLRARLLVPLRRLGPDAFAATSSDISGGPESGKMLRCTIATMTARAAAWVLDGDAAFLKWRRGQGIGTARSPPVRDAPHAYLEDQMRCATARHIGIQPRGNDVLRVSNRCAAWHCIHSASCVSQITLRSRCRAMLAGIIVRKDRMMWSAHHHADLDPRTARFAVCTAAQGEGLAASAFGMLHCKADVDMLLQRWLAPRHAGDAAYRAMARHTLVAYSAGWLDSEGLYDEPGAPPIRSDARHYIVRDRSRLPCQGAAAPADTFAADALGQLCAAGARAVPLVPGLVPGVEEREFTMTVLKESLGMSLLRGAPAGDAAAMERAQQGRRDFLLQQGGACASIASSTRARGACAPYPDLVLQG